uniref:NADH-ubiquinone oxidoreductase chain 1 n=1 Tax=Solemya elarraichensis TaxID=1345011 RepID=A0A1W5WVG2_9BIVA|nr:NADH dehydrogenase subunit 1 [Solemya elarraichensis]ARH10755.1 NADH dehydrogenase subunit 1 [Solemya elarraichensis]
MVLSFVSIVISYVLVLLGMAFFTLLERKGLGYFQIRKGPNKVGLAGLPQPLADAAKLLTKEMVSPTMINVFPYFFAPVFSLILALMLWQLYPSEFLMTSIFWGILLFLCISSLNVYGTLVAGWASNSKYSLLGSLRAVAQTISYEVSLSLIMLFSLCVSSSFSFFNINLSNEYMWIGMLMVPISAVWYVSTLAETNRAPFDFAEGESEIVSGFNIEYSAGGFALIFMAEYTNILFMSMMSALLFFGGSFFIYSSDLMMFFKVLIFSFVFVWARATLPRLRYDLLMNLTWKGFLPVSLGGLIFVCGMKFLIELI